MARLRDEGVLVAPPLILRIISDARQAFKTNDELIASNTLVGRSGLTMGTDLAKGSKTAIASSLALEDALGKQAHAYRVLAADASLSAREQAKAAQLAEVAELKLARAQGVVVAGSRGVGKGAQTAERDLNKMTRGVLAGSGALSGLGRSLAFSSTGFIAASLGAAGVVSSIKDAEDLARAQASLSVAIAHTGGNLATLQPRYEATAKAAAQFGVTEVEATTGLARATVLTGDAAAAQRAYQEALVISKATGKDFNSVLIATSKGQEGITTSLRRYGILVDSTSSGTEQFTQVMKRFGGQAAANTTATEKLHAAFTNALTTIGEQLLPTFERLSGSLADWLTKMNESGKLQKDVAGGMKLIGDVASPLVGTIKDLASAIGDLNKAWKWFNNLGNSLGLGGLGIPGPLDLLKGGLQNITPLHAVTSFVQSFRSSTPPPAPLVPPSRFGLSNQSLFGAAPPSAMFGTAQPLKQFWKTFNLTLKQQMAVAQAALTKSNQDDIAAAKQQIARIKTLLAEGRLHGPALLLALQMEANDLATIWNAEAAAAQKRAAKAQAAKDKIIKQIQNAIDPINLQIAFARAEALGGNTTAVLRKQLAAAYKGLAEAIANGNKQLILQAYQQIKSIKDAIKSSVSTAASTFTVPAKLALDIARDQALGKGITDDLKEERRALYKWIASHRKNIQGVTDAYNQITAINSQLNSDIVNAYGMFKKASVKKLTANIGLTPDQRRRLEERLSQVGPGGTTPGEGTGAAGYVIDPLTGRPVHRGHHNRNRQLQGGGAGGGAPVIHNVIDLTVNISGKRVEASVTENQQRRRRHNPTQTRGPNAATSVA